MKRLNRKGFTLIELMVVIAILVVIMGIALPNITSSIERSKQKQIETKRKLVVSAGELYFDRHKSTCNKEQGVTLNALVSDDLVTEEEVEDICSEKNEPYHCCVRYSNGKLEFVDDVQDCEHSGACGYSED